MFIPITKTKNHSSFTKETGHPLLLIQSPPLSFNYRKTLISKMQYQPFTPPANSFL